MIFKKRTSNEEDIASVLQRTIDFNNLQSGLDKIDVADAWKKMMGNGVNTYTKDVVFKNGTLYVALTSSVLREELNYGKTKIIKLLNEHLGRDIITNVILK